MTDVADTMRDDADAMLTSDRLATQQAQIARRLEALDRPARVIAFPKAPATNREAASSLPRTKMFRMKLCFPPEIANVFI